MRLVVIESPLAGDFERNRRYALWCAYDCYVRGEAAYASHLLYPQFLDDEVPDEREFGISAGLAWAARADLRVFYLDLAWSPGMMRARKALEASENAASTILYEERTLPLKMLRLFERGECPNRTPAFGERSA